MQAIELETQIQKNGQICLPEFYQNWFGKHARLILLESGESTVELEVKRKNKQFWQPKSLDVLREEQGSKMFNSVKKYEADFLPEDETMDEWLDFFKLQRQKTIEC